MAQWNFDPNQYEEKSFSIIPVGDYRVRISDVEEKTFRSGNSGYEITLEVNGYSRRLWTYLVLDPSDPAKTNQRLGDFFNSFGITNYIMGSGKQWIGSVGAVRVKHEEYNGNQTDKVAFFISRDRQDKLAPWKNNGPAPAAQSDELPFDL